MTGSNITSCGIDLQKLPGAACDQRNPPPLVRTHRRPRPFCRHCRGGVVGSWLQPHPTNRQRTGRGRLPGPGCIQHPTLPGRSLSARFCQRRCSHVARGRMFRAPCIPCCHDGRFGGRRRNLCFPAPAPQRVRPFRTRGLPGTARGRAGLPIHSERRSTLQVLDRDVCARFTGHRGQPDDIGPARGSLGAHPAVLRSRATTAFRGVVLLVRRIRNAFDVDGSTRLTVRLLLTAKRCGRAASSRFWLNVLSHTLDERAPRRRAGEL